MFGSGSQVRLSTACQMADTLLDSAQCFFGFGRGEGLSIDESTIEFVAQLVEATGL